MDLQLLDAFLTVAETGSFSRTAESLHLSQPAVSKRIAALEAHFGVTLFDRIGRHTTMTEAGRTLLPHARRMLWEMEDSRRALSKLSARVAGRLSLGISHHIGLHHLPSILRRFTLSYADVELDLHFQDSEQACAQIEHGDLEMAVVTLPPEERSNLKMLEIWPDPLSIVVAEDHPLAGRNPVSTGDLAHHSAILPAVGTYTRSLVEQALAGADTRPARTLVTNYMETIRMLVGIGLGWSALPRTLLDDQLTVLEIPELTIQRRLGAVWHAQRSLSNAAGVLLEMLRGIG